MKLTFYKLEWKMQSDLASNKSEIWIDQWNIRMDVLHQYQLDSRIAFPIVKTFFDVHRGKTQATSDKARPVNFLIRFQLNMAIVIEHLIRTMNYYAEWLSFEWC